MASTFATLRALQLVIADALDDIHRVFSQHAPPSPPSLCSYVCPYSPDLSPATSPFPTTPPASFPPTPLSATFPSALRSPDHTDIASPYVDYPSPDSPMVSNSPSEQLALHPDAVAAASRIVAACGQMSNIVHKPFSSLCDVVMSYNLPACMRLMEHLHVAEILREAEESKRHGRTDGHEAIVALFGDKADPNLGEREPIPTSSALGTDGQSPTTTTVQDWTPSSHVAKGTGLHVTEITNVICSYAGINYVDPDDLVHALRLLSTHHIFRETAPDTFALTRVASLLDSGKSVKAVFSNPDTKYDDIGGIPAFVAMSTDELFKSAAYLTEAFTGVQLSAPPSTPNPSFGSDAILPTAATIPSISSFIINDLVPCAPTARSSSILTHVVYPEDDDSRPPSRPLSLTEPPRLSLSLTAPSIQVEKERLLSPETTKSDKLPAFNLAFRTHAPFFEWLENGGEDPLGGIGQGACSTLTKAGNTRRGDALPNNVPDSAPAKPFRFKRFSKAMIGTTLWEAPKAILTGFDWCSLPKGSTVVDVGGGIGSTTMILTRALNDPRPRVDSVKRQHATCDEESHTPKVAADPPLILDDEQGYSATAKNDVNLRFVVQDKPVVTALGIEAWRTQCPELLEGGQVVFQAHDFFEPQPPFEPSHLARHPAVYLLRVVLHDWPDECARRILINLRVASNAETRLVIAEHVLPLACMDGDVVEDLNAERRVGSSTEDWTLNSVLANVEGAERTLVPPPLLSNMGKANANAYCMDLIMHITFNGKERTLREFCALALSAGWRVTRMTRPEGTLFAYLVCEPIALPDDAQAIHNAVVLSSELSTVVAVPPEEHSHRSYLEPSRLKRLPERPVSLLPSPILQRSSSRCGTPTFGSYTVLPKDEELQSPRTRGAGVAKKWLKSKGLGMRGVMMQKAEKQREEQNSAKGAPARDDAQDGARTSSHGRVWWKKSPPNSSGNSTITAHDPNGEVPEHHTANPACKKTHKQKGSPSTPSPRASPVHQKWPSTDSAALLIPETSPSVSRGRRRSVATITRKLSFATFGRRPSIADIAEPLPTPPPTAVVMDLAPPPTLQGDTGRRLKHLPSLPALGRSEVVPDANAERPPVPRRPSFGTSVGQGSQPVPKTPLPRRSDAAGTPKSGILKARASSHAGKPGFPDLGRSPEPTVLVQRERRVTLSSSPGVSSSARARAQVSGAVHVLPDPVVKRVPSVPKLPRRLSIPMLRRKQS